MRETTANGKQALYMKRDSVSAINRLAELGVIGAAREWERAALVALLVRPGKGGRPSRSANKVDQQQFSIAEFAAKGIYGLTSVKSVAAYLRAWKISGLPVPEFGQKIELPAIDFPPFEQLYTITPAPEPGPEPESEQEPEPEEETRRSRPPQEKAPAPKRPDYIEKILRNLREPKEVIDGRGIDECKQFSNTFHSWLDDLDEAIAEMGG